MTALAAALVLLCQDADLHRRLVATLPDKVQVDHAFFARFGAVTGYIAREAPRDSMVRWAVLGDWKSPSDWHIMDCIPCKDGSTAAILAARKVGENYVSLISLKDRIVEEFPDQKRRTFRWGAADSSSLSHDGKTFAYFGINVRERKQHFGLTVAGTKERGDYPFCLLPIVGGDGKVIAFRVSDDDLEKAWIVVGDREHPKYDDATSPAVSDRNGVVAYGVEEDGKWFLVVGTKKSPVDGRIYRAFLSPDGSVAGHVVRRSEKKEDGAPSFFYRVVLGGVKSEEWGSVSDLSLHPNGKTTLYAARGLDGKQYVVVGNRKIEAEGVQGGPEFSADGSKAGFGIRKGRELWWVAVDLTN